MKKYDKLMLPITVYLFVFAILNAIGVAFALSAIISIIPTTVVLFLIVGFSKRQGGQISLREYLNQLLVEGNEKLLLDLKKILDGEITEIADNLILVERNGTKSLVYYTCRNSEIGTSEAAELIRARRDIEYDKCHVIAAGISRAGYELFEQYGRLPNLITLATVYKRLSARKMLEKNKNRAPVHGFLHLLRMNITSRYLLFLCAGFALIALISPFKKYYVILSIIAAISALVCAAIKGTGRNAGNDLFGSR